MQSIWIKYTQAATIVSILNVWKNIAQKNLVTVALEKVDVLAIAD
jgi:hypothetical protein